MLDEPSGEVKVVPVGEVVMVVPVGEVVMVVPVGEVKTKLVGL